MSIIFKVNDQLVSVDKKDSRKLLDYLREELKLTGTKYGCGTNDCGACKVLIDGKGVNSCTQLVRNLGGKEILTIEYFSSNGTLHPLQQAFVDVGAVQCGFCTPGMIISGLAFLNENPQGSRNEIRQALEGNLCRCTGYEKIIEAIERTIERS